MMISCRSWIDDDRADDTNVMVGNEVMQKLIWRQRAGPLECTDTHLMCRMVLNII